MESPKEESVLLLNSVLEGGEGSTPTATATATAPLPLPLPLPPMVIMLPSPGMGHLIPMIEFAKRLVVVHQKQLRVTFAIPVEGPPSKAQITVLQSLPNSISHIFLPPVTIPQEEDASKIETRISLTVLNSLPSLRQTLLSLSSTHSLTSLLVDLFGTDAFDVAKEFNIPPYIFYPSTATALSLFLYLPRLHREVHCEYRDLTEPVQIPGCIPIHGKELLDPVQDRKNEAYNWVLHHANRYTEAVGIIENSFLELEPGPIKELQKEGNNPQFYPVGPLVKMEETTTTTTDKCLSWLDDQPQGSVLFVSFGSGGTLSSTQIIELAFGLEMSEQRFLWVVRTPNDKVANASYFNADNNTNAAAAAAAAAADPFHFLPKGFLERTKGRGLVVSSWAPQARVLAHASTGGFLSHCGWNSVLESVVNGVPIVAWPLFAEQKMNAVILTQQDVKVALRVNKFDDNGLVDRMEIASVVKRLMEGEEGKKLRYQMKDLKEAAHHALAQNGSSSNHISNLALKWTNHKSTTTTITSK